MANHIRAGLFVVGVLIVHFCWLMLPIPGSHTLPHDWFGVKKEVELVASTANATWWMVLATFLAALATLSAVLVALGQETRRVKGEDAERTRLNMAAKQALLNVFDFFEASDPVAAKLQSQDVSLGWELNGKAAVHRRTLEHYLKSTITSDDLVFECNAGIQRLYEFTTGMDYFVKNGNLTRAQSVIKSAISRAEKSKAAAVEAPVEAINGTVGRKVEARGIAN